jgi:hypothetical protein
MPAPDSSGPPQDLARLIEVLDRHGVEYLLVGGATCVALRVPKTAVSDALTHLGTKRQVRYVPSLSTEVTDGAAS